MGIQWPEPWALELLEVDTLLIQDANQWNEVKLTDIMGIVMFPFFQIIRRAGGVEYVKAQDFLDHYLGIEYASTVAVLQRPVSSPIVSLWLCAKYISQK
jgi:hypothetical protein